VHDRERDGLDGNRRRAADPAFKPEQQVAAAKELPREQLERKFLLRKMQDQQQKQGYDAKVKAWLDKPEQAELVKSLKATISPNIKPEKQAQTLVNQAKNYIRNTGIKIS
jgi:hypothetical protein